VDPTNIANQTWDTLISNFGERVFETRIRRSVKLREAPALGKTIFHHAPESAGARDYMGLANEVMARLKIGDFASSSTNTRPALSVVQGVVNE
jgi:cellulose biosynthesis protein BcsQ